MLLKPVQLDIDFDPYINADYEQHSGSCITHQVHELTDIHEQHGGFPDSYNYDNTMIHQLWWEQDQIDYAELGRQMNMEVVTVSTIKQPPGCTIPYHRDTFFQIRKRYPERTETLVRANIYIEDWKLGHFIQYTENRETKTSVNWKQGEGFLWDSGILHLSANAGFQPKLTMQISGFYLD